MKRLIVGVGLLSSALLVTSLPVAAETRYVTEKVTVGLFDDQKMSGRAGQRLLAGTKVEVLQTVDGISQITTAGGVQGWLRENLLTKTAPSMIRIDTVEAESKRLKGELVRADREVKTLRKKLKELEAALAAKDPAPVQAEPQAEAQTASVAEADAGELQQLREQNRELQFKLAGEMINAEPASEPGIVQLLTNRYSLALAAVALVLGLVLGGMWTYKMLDIRLRRRFGGIKFH